MPLPPPQIGMGLSAITYMGDLNPTLGPGSRVSPGLALSLQFPGHAPVGPELHVGMGKMMAQGIPAPDSPAQTNAFVETEVKHIDFRLHLMLFQRFRFTPFCAAGVGIILYAPKDQEGYALIDNIKTRAANELYSGAAAFFPVAAGFKYRINHRTSITVEGTMCWMQTDYLDNIGQLGNLRGDDRLLSLTASYNIRLGDFYLRKLEHQLQQQDTGTVAALPPTVQASSPALQAIHHHHFVYYRARKGENPDSLAQRIGLDKDLIRQLNYLPPNGVLPESFNLKLPNIWFNGVNHLFPEAYLAAQVEARAFLYYPVNPGDTFDALAFRYGVPDALLRKINFVPQGEPESGSLLRLPLLYDAL